MSTKTLPQAETATDQTFTFEGADYVIAPSDDASVLTPNGMPRTDDSVPFVRVHLGDDGQWTWTLWRPDTATSVADRQVHYLNREAATKDAALHLHWYIAAGDDSDRYSVAEG